MLHETVARRPAEFAKAPEHWKTLDTCCLCCRRDIISNSAFFMTFANVLISGKDSSSDTRCAWLLNSSCKACVSTQGHTQTDTFTYVISHNSWFRLKINRACRHSKTVDYANGFVLQKSVMRKKNHDRKFFYLKFWKRREDLEISFNQRFIRIYISF